MQSSNYGDLRETYRSKGLTWKIKKALVEGLSLRYKGESGKDERGRHYRLIKEYSANNNVRMAFLKRFFDKPENQIDKENPNFLDDVLRDFHPTYGKWKKSRFTKENISELIKEEVIFESKSTDAEGLLHDLIEETERRQVVIANVQLSDTDINYKKLPNNKIILLNGAGTIRKFAEDKFNLPARFSSITNEIYEYLIAHHFSFPAALYTAAQIVQNQLAFAIRRPDGNKTYLFLGGLFEGDELYEETKRFRPTFLDTSVEELVRHGKINWNEFKYHGQNIFRVPRRSPRVKKYYDSVTTKYLPNLDRPRDMWLEWFNTEMICDCDYALDFRNKEERTGKKMVRYTQIHDAHSRWVIRLIDDNSSNKNSAQMIYPTAWAIGLMDAIRNRLYNKAGNGKEAMNVLLMAALRVYGTDKLLQYHPLKSEEIIKPLYTGINVIRK